MTYHDSEHADVGDRVTGLRDRLQLISEPRKALPAHLAPQFVHAAEMRVDGHRRCSDFPGQTSQRQSGSTLGRDEPCRGLYEFGA